MSVLIDDALRYMRTGHIKNGKYVMPAFKEQYVWIWSR